jgi:hypothetical protein
MYVRKLPSGSYQVTINHRGQVRTASAPTRAAAIVKVGGMFASGANSNMAIQLGWRATDTGVVLREDSTLGTFAQLLVGQAGTDPTLPTDERLVSDSEYKRRRTITMLLYKQPDANEWWVACMNGQLEDGQVFADVPLFSGNGNGAAMGDVVATPPTLTVTTREAVARTVTLSTFRCGVITW